jgi:BirA family biotin operon repressor/biotin-[acetyl-CoA-carboxylase] ligase
MKIKIIKYKSVKSTNNTAIRRIKYFKQPIIIYSESQKKGKGTMGKIWISKKGNLFLSILFEFNPAKVSFKQHAVLNAYLVRKILQKYVIKRIKIKWPNDLLIEKKKVCGILQEVINYKNKNFLIVGIGVNTCTFPKIVNYKISSLKDYSNKKVNNDKILKDIKKIYEKFIYDIKKYNFFRIKKSLK